MAANRVIATYMAFPKRFVSAHAPKNSPTPRRTKNEDESTTGKRSPTVLVLVAVVSTLIGIAMVEVVVMGMVVTLTEVVVTVLVCVSRLVRMLVFVDILT